MQISTFTDLGAASLCVEPVGIARACVANFGVAGIATR